MKSSNNKRGAAGALPLVAIIGRPNVGKSTIFNRILGKRVAIVDEMEGVTRDRIYADAEWNGNRFRIVDCGGIARESADPLHEIVSDNALTALAEADLVLFIVDARAGVTDADDFVKREVWKSGKPSLLVLNKVDSPKLEAELYEFYGLGFDDIVSISAANGRFFHNLLDLVNVKLGFVPANDNDLSKAEKRLLKAKRAAEYDGVGLFDESVEDDEGYGDADDADDLGNAEDLSREYGEPIEMPSNVVGDDEYGDIAPDWGDDDTDDDDAETGEDASTSDLETSRSAAPRKVKLLSDGKGGYALDGDVSLLDYIKAYHDKGKARDAGDSNVASDSTLDAAADSVTGKASARDEKWRSETVRIALLGRQNVGKSSLANAFVGNNRLIVSTLPGTTRDPIRLEFESNGIRFTVLDTAGLKKLSRVRESVDFYSMVRTSRELPDTDVSILIVDAVEGIFEMDKLVAKKIGEAGKAVIIAVNKWDLLDDSDAMRHEYLKYVRSHFVKLSWADIVFVSALKGQGLSELLEAVLNALAMYHKRVPQKVLREVLFEEITLHPPPVMKNNPLKFYDMRQVSTCPPTFKLWINLKKGLHFSYRGFIENTIRGHFGFRGTFINVIYEEKKRRDRSSRR